MKIYTKWFIMDFEWPLIPDLLDDYHLADW